MARSADRARGAMPKKLLDTYDDLDRLVKNDRPSQSARQEMLVCCIEGFDWLVNLIANSFFCIADLMPQDDPMKARYARCKRASARNCATCIRTYVYREIQCANENKGGRKT